jgi:hypothetical protein
MQATPPRVTIGRKTCREHGIAYRAPTELPSSLESPHNSGMLNQGSTCNSLDGLTGRQERAMISAAIDTCIPLAPFRRTEHQRFWGG